MDVHFSGLKKFLILYKEQWNEEHKRDMRNSTSQNSGLKLLMWDSGPKPGQFWKVV